MEGTMAEIRMFAGNFAPMYWSFCDGSLIAISQNSALFALLGTLYGGDGVQNFALPDLRSRVPVGIGAGPGLPNISLAQKGGSEFDTLLVENLPSHNHMVSATVAPAASTGGRGVTTTNVPTNNFPAQTAEGTNIYANTANTAMGQSQVQITLGATGNSLPVNNIQPFLGMNYIICLEGVFPSRN